MLDLILATHNAAKTREFVQILGSRFALADLTKAGNVATVEETGATFEENAVLKAVAASRAVAALVVADDSGLEVAALSGAPGVRSARYAGENATDEENVAKLLAELGTVENRAARFCCAIAVASQGQIGGIFRSCVTGVIAAAPRGDHGFGYDPVFIPDGSIQTFGELGEEAKNRLSHRALAVAQLREYLDRLTSRS
ncbi:MAG: RdgB/HAM1 family non-canonical purine NTP pyrophosphatase [Chthoniobacterales bacterium]|nr:RdgB/HAM1 family non-canonical purine NTP pyrophosphatase [Chthoniobacterales bacterium]